MNTRITVFGVVLIGLWLIAVGVGLIPVQAGTLHAPRWILSAVGGVFLTGGLLAATGSGGRLATALAATLLTLLGLIGGWAAILADGQGFQTTLGRSALGVGPGAPVEERIAFGIGALIVLVWAAYAWRLVLRLR